MYTRNCMGLIIKLWEAQAATEQEVEQWLSTITVRFQRTFKICSVKLELPHFGELIDELHQMMC